MIADAISASLLTTWFNGVLSKLDAILYQGGKLMETIQSVTAKLDAIATATAEERAQVQAMAGDLRSQIQQLQDQIAAGQLVTQEQLDALGAQADAIVAQVRDISEPIPAPDPAANS